MTKTFRRAHLRSPLRESILYVDGDYVFRARSMNISEGGILLENLPHVPEVAAIPLMIPLPQYLEFSKVADETLMGLDRDSFEAEIIRVKCRIVRSFEGQSEIDKIFVNFIGCQFVVSSDEDRKKIDNYVRLFGKNVLNILGLFERAGGDAEIIAKIRHFCYLLGFPHQERLPILRQIIQHEYQSLETL